MARPVHQLTPGYTYYIHASIAHSGTLHSPMHSHRSRSRSTQHADAPGSSQTAFLINDATMDTLHQSKLPQGTLPHRAKPVSNFEPTNDATDDSRAIRKIDLAVDYGNPNYNDEEDFEY